MDFRKETRGAGATKAVELVATFYDNAVHVREGRATVHFAEMWGHPDAEVSQGQTNLALVTQRTEHQGKTRWNHSVALYPNQVDLIKEAAGDNQAPLLDAQGVRRGTIYGFRADLMSAMSRGRQIGFQPNSKTIQPSELSVAEVDGKDIRSRIFEAMRETREAEKALETVAKQSEQEAEVAVERETAPGAGETKKGKSKKGGKKDKSHKPAEVDVEAAAPEPELV